MMKKFYSIIVVVLSFTLASFGQTAEFKSIKKDNLKSRMTYFASDELQGRETGTPANDSAALYIKKSIKNIGLKPLPETGDFFQDIPFKSKRLISRETYLEIDDKNGKSIFSTDSLILFDFPNQTIEIKGNVVFAGYGYNDTISGYNDLKDVDIKDKIVFFMTRNPNLVKKDEGKSVIQFDVEEPKLRYLAEKGPKALFLVYDPMNNYQNPYTTVINEIISNKKVDLKNDSIPSYTSPFQIGFITQHAADMLLKTTGLSLREMQEKIYSTNKPVSLEIPNITATLKVAIEYKEFVGKNVIGIIEGSDLELKNECIIYTAHFDHVGLNEKGEVFNGADDDASGSMALIEIAQAYTRLKVKPLRTIVFAWVNGEEKGLLGSNYYVNHPAFPLKKTLVDINLDMIGRSKSSSDTGKFMMFDLNVTKKREVLLYTSPKSSQFNEMIRKSAKQSGVKVIDMGDKLEFGSSDHASFIEKGVPGLLFISGIHADLHSPRDDADKIDFDKMEKVSRMVFLLGYRVSNQRERVTIDKKETKK